MRQCGKCSMWEMRTMCGSIVLHLRNDINVPDVCPDVDECISPLLNKCSYTSGCVNTRGSFHCSCQDGAVLDNDGVTCVSESLHVTCVIHCAGNSDTLCHSCYMCCMLIIVTSLLSRVVCHADNSHICWHLCHVMMIIVKPFVIRVI